MIRFIKKKTFNEFCLFDRFVFKISYKASLNLTCMPISNIYSFILLRVSHIHVHLNYLFICKYNSLHKFYLIAMHYIVALYYEIIQLSYF